MTVVDEFEKQLPRLFWLAYRLLGSASEGEEEATVKRWRLPSAEPGAFGALVADSVPTRRGIPAE